MTATSTCITSLDLCGMRIAKLAESGSPSAGVHNGYFSDAPVSIKVTVETEAGDDKTQKNGCGQLMFSLRTPDKLKALSFELNLCQLDADVLALMTGATVFRDSGGRAIGSQMAAVGDSADPLCFEGWSKAWDVDHQYAPTFTSPNAAYIHWVFPFTRWVQGDFTLDDNLLVFPVKGVGSENSHITTNGPFDDWPTEIRNAGGITRLGGWFFDATLPTATCDYIAVTSLAS